VIARLPEAVIDQIAAGEVVERPASVVKELIDNALDAAARTIVVEAQAGGRVLVRVVDDGSGMSPADAVLALERHATSKLRAVDELWGLATMGFRGEALPAIASVSRLALTTRRACDLVATRVTMEGARRVAVEEVGAPVGTTVEVADLFWNVPARLKFLRGEATEASHVTDVVARAAMAHPALHLRLRHNGKTALELPPDRDGLGRVRALLGGRVAARVIAASGEEHGVRVACFLAAPELAQTTARGVQIYVGRRPVRDRGVLHAVAMGYGELIARGRYPVAVVLIDVPGGQVDVNVHPQKLEVRFAHAAEVAQAVRHVVQSAVARAPWRGDVSAGPVMMTAIASVAPPALPFDAGATPLAQRYARDLRSQARFGWYDGGRFASASRAAGGRRDWIEPLREHVRAGRAAEPEAVPWPGPEDHAGLAEGSAPARGFFASLAYLGQLDLTYLVCEGDGELVLIDQHVAHERVELARLTAQGDREVATQRMLFPATLELPPALVETAAQMAGVLARVGYEVEPFGAGTLAVKAVPAGIRHGDPTELLRGLVAAPSLRLERVRAEIACHSVVRAGDRLAPGEAEALLRALDAVDPATPNPHDRPVVLRLPLAEIARRFGRRAMAE